MDIDVAACRARQQRLLSVLHARQLDLAIVSLPEHVQYLMGPRFHWAFMAFGVLLADGRSILVGPEQRIPASHAADEVLTYAARWHSTMRNDQREAATRVLYDRLRNVAGAAAMGVEFSTFTRHWPGSQSLHDLEPDLYRLRRNKDADELARIVRATEATGRMYERAREWMRPGLNELDLFNELQSVAVATLGEMLTATGNDYQCNSRGGAPRSRLTQPGELYILDLGPAFQGYFADNARTLAVDEPSVDQLRAWEHTVEVFGMVESLVRPGVSARELFERVQQWMDRAPLGKFNHHLGHGIGLFPHEGPHLNPHWDDTFAEGDVFTAEPGLYAPELRAGLRLENTYRVTASGVERLTSFPLELKL